MACLVSFALACEVGTRSGRGLRLPDGDVDRGARAFAELGCGRCHDVVGEPPAHAGARADTIVELGGEISRVHSYGELVTALANPTHEIAGGSRDREDRVVDGVSKMELEGFNERMSVAQLIDLVAFLQSKYERRPEPIYVR